MNYEEKKQIANNYLLKYGVNWDDLPDINSLYDVEAREDIESLCDDRLEDAGLDIIGFVDGAENDDIIFEND